MKKQPIENPRPWLAPAHMNIITPGLYLVSTPIGNLGDITFRALDTLSRVDAILCEDTRITGKLLTHYGITGSLVAYHDHNETRLQAMVLKRLQAGQALALVSDAGTPLISDPGYRLVQSCISAGVPVTSIPGANAVLPALQLSALPSDNFAFIGFLPSKAGERRKILQRWLGIGTTVIAYESPRRVAQTLADIAVLDAARSVAVMREITKKFEETRRGTASEMAAHYAADDTVKGEVVIAIGPADATGMDNNSDATWAAIDKDLRKALKTLRTREAADHVSAQYNRPRKEIYARALALQAQDKP